MLASGKIVSDRQNSGFPSPRHLPTPVLFSLPGPLPGRGAGGVAEQGKVIPAVPVGAGSQRSREASNSWAGSSFQTVGQMWPYICQFVEKLLHEVLEPAVKASDPHLSTFCFSKIDIGDKVSWGGTAGRTRARRRHVRSGHK